MKNKEAYNFGGMGSENYFGGPTRFDYKPYNYPDSNTRIAPKTQLNVEQRFPYSCQNYPNSINCQHPQMVLTKDQIGDLAHWFYSDAGGSLPYDTNGISQGKSIGPKEPHLKSRVGYSNGNWGETRRWFGPDTTFIKDQVGGRYDGQSRYSDDYPLEDWYRERPTRDFTENWLRFNKGDDKIGDFLLYRWATNQHGGFRWDTEDLGRQELGVITDATQPRDPRLKKRRHRFVNLVKQASLSRRISTIINHIVGN